MRWLKIWKAGIAIAGLLLFLVLMVWVPVSTAATYERASGFAGPGTVTLQTPSTTDLADAVLFRADLSDANLGGANLSAASSYEAKFIRAGLTEAKLVQAKLEDADLSNANLTGADLTNADLSGANLKGANLKDANIEDANYLKNTNLCDVKGLTKEQLEACKAKGAIIDDDTTTSSPQLNVSPSPSSRRHIKRRRVHWQTPSAPPAQATTPPPSTDAQH